MNSKKNKKKSKPHPKPAVLAEQEKKETSQNVIEEKDVLDEKQHVPVKLNLELVVNSEENIPEKPKRNQRKKKREEKDIDLNENVREKNELNVSTVVESTVNLDANISAKLDVECAEAKCLKSGNETESKLRKKNKKNENELNIEISSNELQIQPEKRDVMVSSNDKKNVDIDCTERCNKPEIEYEKKINKKNKKKKRHDSGPSDKTEEISLTLKEVVDNASELYINTAEAKLEMQHTQSFAEVSKVDLIIEKEEISKISTQSIQIQNEEPVSVVECAQHKINEVKPTKTEEIKSNKKKKKGKKYPKEIGDESQIVSTDEPIISVYATVTDSILEDTTQKGSELPHGKITTLNLNKPNTDEDGDSVKDSGPKTKAVIAKPVERILKSKPDSKVQTTISEGFYFKPENLEENTLETKSVAENYDEKKTDTKFTMKDIPEDIKQQTLQKVDTNLKDIQDSKIIKTEDYVISKKRKKSPKIPKVNISCVTETSLSKENLYDVELGEATPVLIDQDNNSKFSHSSSKCIPELKPKKKSKKLPKIPLTPGVVNEPPVFDIDTVNILEVDEVLTTKESDKNIALDTEFKITKEIKDSSDVSFTCSHETFTSDWQSQTHIRDKKPEDEENKSKESFVLTEIPFIDIDVDLIVEKAEIPLNDIKSEFGEVMKSEHGKKCQKKDINIDDIIVDNPKSEMETPTLDIIPEIYYPRSTSQELDSNNNTMIREMRPGELQLTMNKDVPVVQGSGETPNEPQKTLISDIVISEVSETERSKEKTDLKSKMLEVNKDMEDLRKSIERSIAEFTALEKNDESIGKNFEVNIEVPNQENQNNRPYYDSSQGTNLGITEDLKYSLATNKLREDDGSLNTKEVAGPQYVDFNKEKNMDTKNPETSEPLKGKDEEQESISTSIDSVEKGNAIRYTTLKEIKQDPSNLLCNQSEAQNKETKCLDKNILACSVTKDNKGKNKKKRGRQETVSLIQSAPNSSEDKDANKEAKKEEKSDKSEENSDSKQQKGKQQTTTNEEEFPSNESKSSERAFNLDYEPIESFEDALSSSTDDIDISKSFDMIVSDTNAETELVQQKLAANKPEIKIIGPDEKPKENITPPKNLLGHPDIPVSSNKIDYKKEKNKTPNTKQARVKIKDSVELEVSEKVKSTNVNNTDPSDNASFRTKEHSCPKDIKIGLELNSDNKKISNELNTYTENNEIVINKDIDKQMKAAEIDNEINGEVPKPFKKGYIESKISRESQTETKKRQNNIESKGSFTQLNENEEFVYKYSFRKVFLPNTCNVCKKSLKQRVVCNFCNLLFYCSNKHKDDDWPQHQSLCFAISTIGHLKDQKYIYENTKNITGQNYRLMRMQMILSCEKVLKRRLVPWEQELLLYPRICAEVSCRQWKQGKLKDCEGCGQISFCADQSDHLPKTHQRWCKSYYLYQKLVIHQQTKGRLEPRLPSRVMVYPYKIPDKINEVLASMYEEKIDMDDIQYAALTQLATAPLTAAYGYQVYTNKTGVAPNGLSKKTKFVIHVVGAELQFEADALNKWELFFLHLRPNIQELKVVLVSMDLNPSNLPLDLLGKIKHCEYCRADTRRVTFNFQDKKTYSDYRSSEDYCYPDLVCAFNPNIQRSSIYKELDTWPSTINSILRTKAPFIITGYTITDLLKDSFRIKECVEVDYKTVVDAKYNSFASVRPDRNFITDDEVPLLFKNSCFMIICGC